MRFKVCVAASSILLLILGDAAVGQSFPDDDTAEVALWQTVQNSTRASDFQGFLLLYPRGRLSNLARLRLARLGGAQTQAGAVEPADADADAEPAATPQLYHIDVSPNVVTMGQTVTVKCRGFMAPALYDRIVVVPVGTPDFTAAGKVDERRLLWNGLANLYDCSGAGIGLPMMMKGSYEVRYVSRQYNPDGRLEVVARSGFVNR